MSRGGVRLIGLILLQLYFGYECVSQPIDNFCYVKDFLDEVILLKSSATTKCLRDSCTDCNKSNPSSKLKTSLDDWSFSSTQLLLTVFPIDPVVDSYIRQVKNVVFSKTNPVPLLGKVILAAWSDSVLIECLDLDPVVTLTKEFADIFSGRTVLQSSTPLTHRYGGHQFGIWAGQLGDGRAHLLGEYVSHKDGSRWEIQLKGSGRTPYSRSGDGRAVVRSSVREFLASEAMHYLGVPTSRAGALFVADETVIRDPLYNGLAAPEPAAIVMRLAPSWFRFGSFEILAHSGEVELLKTLTDFVIKTHFKEFSDITGTAKYLALFGAVVTQTATLMAQWMSYGFAHGVCNTDNFSILSITIDYGPFRFMDDYDPDMVPNTSDDEQRYSFSKQPAVGRYNLVKLQSAFSALLPAEEHKYLKLALDSYDYVYRDAYRTAFRAKLGLAACHNVYQNDDVDDMLVADLLSMMAIARSDFTMTFRQLAYVKILDQWHKNKLTINCEMFWALKDLCQHPGFNKWLEVYANRLNECGISDEMRLVSTHRVNPRYVLRNWMAQRAIEATQRGDFHSIHEIHAILKDPFNEQSLAEKLGYASKPPAWSQTLKVSCSS